MADRIGSNRFCARQQIKSTPPAVNPNNWRQACNPLASRIADRSPTAAVISRRANDKLRPID